MTWVSAAILRRDIINTQAHCSWLEFIMGLSSSKYFLAIFLFTILHTIGIVQHSIFPQQQCAPSSPLNAYDIFVLCAMKFNFSFLFFNTFGIFLVGIFDKLWNSEYTNDEWQTRKVIVRKKAQIVVAAYLTCWHQVYFRCACSWLHARHEWNIDIKLQ
jgi:hypothetical protein